MSEPLDIEFEEYAPPATRRSTRRPIVILAVTVSIVVLVCICGWQLLHRFDTGWAEREAREKLSEAATLTSLRAASYTPHIIQTKGGKWAKRQVSVVGFKEKMARVDSPAFPYRGVIGIETRELHSITHDSREEADQDDELFPAAVSYYESRKKYEESGLTFTEELHFLEYDLWGREWRSRRTEAYDCLDPLIATESSAWLKGSDGR